MEKLETTQWFIFYNDQLLLQKSEKGSLWRTFTEFPPSIDIKYKEQDVHLPDGRIIKAIALEKSIDELAALYPGVKSMTIVPVGLTKYHKNGLRLMTKDECKKVIEMVIKKSQEYKKKFKTNFVFLPDEFFVKAEMEIPKKEYYEDFEHLENGVGLLRLLLEDAEKLKKKKLTYKGKRCTVVCGVSVFPYMKEIFSNDKNITVIPITNYFFGETITVTGLITASDLIKNLRDVEIGDKLVINRVMLNDDMIFLDDFKIEDVEKALNIKVQVIEKLEEIYK